MNETDLFDLSREAIWITIKIGTPVMVIGLLVGIVIALLQALTQIQEMTLVFVPKILAMLAAMFVLMPMMATTLMEFMVRIADKIIAGQ